MKREKRHHRYLTSQYPTYSDTKKDPQENWKGLINGGLCMTILTYQGQFLKGLSFCITRLLTIENTFVSICV